MEIRLIKPDDDRAALSRILEEGWRHAYRGIVPDEFLDAIEPGRWSKAFDSGAWETMVCAADGRFIGVCSFGASRSPQFSDCGEIICLYLLPDVKGQGIGKALIRAVIRALAERGYREIFLWTLEENRSARAFYEHTGFHASGDEKPHTIGGRELRELRYTYRIQ